MTTRANLYVDQGVDFTVSLDLTINGSDFEVSNQSFLGQARKLYSSSVYFNIDIDIVSANTATHELNLNIPADTTINVEPGKYQYDILMKKDDDTTLKILEGLLILTPTITRFSANT